MQLHELACVLKVGDGGADTPQLLPAGQHEYCQAPLFTKKSILYMHGHLYLLKNGQALFVTVIWMDIFRQLVSYKEYMLCFWGYKVYPSCSFQTILKRNQAAGPVTPLYIHKNYIAAWLCFFFFSEWRYPKLLHGISWFFSFPMTAYEDNLLTKQQHLKQKLNVAIFLYYN